MPECAAVYTPSHKHTHPSTKSSPICNFSFIRNEGWKWNIYCNYSVLNSVFLPFSSQQILLIPGRKTQRASIQTNIDLKKERQDSTNLQQTRKSLHYKFWHFNNTTFSSLTYNNAVYVQVPGVYGYSYLQVTAEKLPFLCIMIFKQKLDTTYLSAVNVWNLGRQTASSGVLLPQTHWRLFREPL